MKGTLWYTGFDAAGLAEIKEKFEKQLGVPVELEYIEDKSLIGGFIAHINGVSYDMSFKHRLDNVRSALHDKADDIPDRKAADSGELEADSSILSGRLSKMQFGGENPADAGGTGDSLRSLVLLPKRLSKLKFSGEVYVYGTVTSAGDGIIQVDGLSGRRYGELLHLSGGATAMALEIDGDHVGAAVLSGDPEVDEQVTGSGHVMEVPVGDSLLGRVLTPTGEPLDGKDAPVCSAHRPIESPAPKIMQRKAVSRPIQTGLISIDSMIPIGRGQRELIIGDRQTGKTTIAIDTILNQKGQDVLCVYCAIGQKASTVAEVVETLKKSGAMDYTVVVSSPASDLPAMQYIAPYAACAIAEGFMYSGKDVLVVYDDLSKHAVAYRAISLLLHRPPGREAYPGDVFYLHSRLLERSAQLSDEEGGGSLTALPIIETMAGDISAYIPTNVISITDGQIFLESELFHSGMRPAVNVGLSVSRVGRSAQRAAMRKVTGTLRLDLAQYREMSVFMQFGADVDSATKNMLENGMRKNELLKQPKHAPYSLAQEVCLLLAADNGIYGKVPADKVGELSACLLSEIQNTAPDQLANIERRYDFDDDSKNYLLRIMNRAADKFAAGL